MGSSKGINLVFKGSKQRGIQISAGGKSLEIALDGNGSVVSLGAPSGCAAKLYGCDSKASFNPR